jgi:hypothetical protein
MTSNTRSPANAFKQGDHVVLAHGTYQGTTGEFLGLREDAKWADITETNGRISAHPVEWLAHSEIALRRRAN